MKNAEKAGNRFTPVSLGHRNALAGRKVRTNSSYLSDSTLLWNENQAYVFESFETVACSNGPTKRSLGHPLVEARCDFVDSIKKKTPKRPHLRVNLVLHKCFRTSHRQGCSPHSPLREKLKRLSRLSCFRLYRSTTKGDQQAWAPHYSPGSSIRLSGELYAR